MPPLLVQPAAANNNNIHNTNRRRRNDTFVGARKLWEETRRVDSTWIDTLRAIIYELQVVRFSTLLYYASNFDIYRKQIVSILHQLILKLYKLSVIDGGNALLKMFLTHTTWNNIAWIGGILLYCYTIRVLHRLFYAGPIIIILTAMIIIWTIGLQDNDNNKKTGGGVFLSAYSVFNRHCRSMLGSLDADALVEQYVAGGGGGMAAVNGIRVAADRQQAIVLGEQGADAVPQQQQQQQQRQPLSRKSGKKARRGNLDQRRDRQRQRQIATEMGFVNEEEDMIDEIEQLLDAAVDDF
jgi:hypothetical protein